MEDMRIARLRWALWICQIQLSDRSLPLTKEREEDGVGIVPLETYRCQQSVAIVEIATIFIHGGSVLSSELRR